MVQIRNNMHHIRCKKSIQPHVSAMAGCFLKKGKNNLKT